MIFAAFSPKLNLLSYFSTIYYIWNIDQSFEPRSSTPGENKTCASTDFFVRNLMLNNFYLRHFLYNAYFWQCRVVVSKISIRIEKFWIKVGTTLYKFLDILKGNFATFLRQFLEKLVKNYLKNKKLFWENFEIIWRNYKIIIFGTFWKFLGKYICQVSFVKQILNYLLKTLIFWIKKNYHPTPLWKIFQHWLH